MVQLLEIYHATQEGCIFFGNMYNDLRKVMGVVPSDISLGLFLIQIVFKNQ